jgi:hypothetical protein
MCKLQEKPLAFIRALQKKFFFWEGDHFTVECLEGINYPYGHLDPLNQLNPVPALSGYELLPGRYWNGSKYAYLHSS